MLLFEDCQKALSLITAQQEAHISATTSSVFGVSGTIETIIREASAEVIIRPPSRLEAFANLRARMLTHGLQQWYDVA